jgi:hypothetical protein
MHNTQDDGEFSYYQSKDELLYLLVSPIVHGARGILIRAADITLMSGGYGDSSQNCFRYPALLQDWGPSIDTEDVDMFERGLCAVDTLTGLDGTSPDFLEALISEDWEVLDEDDAENQEWSSTHGWITDTEAEALNFIALLNSSTWDILLIAVNDSEDEIEDNRYIVFWNAEYDDYFISHAYIAGYWTEQSDPQGPSQNYACFDLSGMPAYTAGLYYLEADL